MKTEKHQFQVLFYLKIDKYICSNTSISIWTVLTFTNFQDALYDLIMTVRTPFYFCFLSILFRMFGQIICNMWRSKVTFPQKARIFHEMFLFFFTQPECAYFRAELRLRVFLAMFLKKWRFQPGCSYKKSSYKKKMCSELR